jgi:hypothetical protein
MHVAPRVIALWMVLATPLLSQSKPQTRQGFTIGFGLGAGSAGITCNGCTTDRQNSGSGYLSIGGTVRPNLIIAGEMNGWGKTITEQGTTDDIVIAYVAGVAQWYPQPQGSFFVKGGLGLGTISDDVTDATGSAKLESTGVAILLGTGYDFRVGKNFSLTPFLNYLATAGGKAQINGALTSEKLNANLVQIGLGFTWH